MGKKKDGGIPNKDIYDRMNFLYQAATLYSQNPLKKYSHHLSSQLKSVSKKLVIRMDPSIKRTICKKCDGVLIPGKTCELDVNEFLVNVVCNVCQHSKRFPIPRLLEKELTVDKQPTE
ncbi:RNAse P Rpr2/Rpp21/SNM1 subunit domain-containing protein [Globomyces pollinis-pini]|nr:RNAse P Rpr2/Rpp21/SNM1 subunit domain-containing protein [Globomyces pollinis-pini]